ncbi:hypothetical protein J6N69_02250 [bacterium]|nr:hypothetical protein [bacterium]
MKLSKGIKFGIFASVFIIFISAMYLVVLPKIVASQKFINFTQIQLEKQLGVKAIIENPELKTKLTPTIEFKIDKLDLTGRSGKILSVDNFDIVLSFKRIFKKTIVLKQLGADNIFVDTNKLSELSFKQDKKEKKESSFNIDVYDSVLYVKKSLILYKVEPNTYVKLNADNIRVDNTQKLQRFIRFNLAAGIKKNGEEVVFNIKDNDSVYFKDNHFWVKNCNLAMNKSNIYFNAVADKKKNFELEVYSDKIDVSDILLLLDSQIIENNLQETISYFDGLGGDFKFKIKLTNSDVSGNFDINKIFCKINPVNKIPVTLEKGNISLTKDRVTLKNVEGFYANRKSNKLTMEGTVDDYLKTVDTKLTARAVVSNDFLKKYLTPMIKTPIELTGGTTRTKIELNAKNNKIDIRWLFGIKVGQDILVSGSSFSPINYDRGVEGNLHIADNIFTIRSLDYYIIPERYRNKNDIKKLRPILKFSGNVDLANNSEIKDFGFEFTHPIPSEFLNIFVGEEMFKKGTIEGNMTYVNAGSYPVLSGSVKMDKVLIPSQRVYLKHGEMNANNGIINIIANGGYRRSKFNLNADFVNEVKFPIIAKDIKLNVDNIDVEKFLASSNNQKSAAIQSEKFDLKPSGTAKDEDDNNPTFDIGNFVVEKCQLKIDNGKYKELTFGNVEANMTLDKNSLLNIKSNRFDIANGHSSAKIDCNLKQHKYHMLLGVKDVDMDIIASNLLQLPKEISGKAKGFIDFNTDDSLKINGSMKFDIVDGTIQKVGMVEYILKFAALFRNPLTMISPSVFSDLVNVPDGRFDNINGKLELKNNVIERLMVRSTASQLSSFIVGRYDLETSDASLRIYTKFSNKNKGLFGVMRNISLNSLANRIPLGASGFDNYYSAELDMIPPIDADEKDCQVFLTSVDGDIEHNNFISALKKIK